MTEDIAEVKSDSQISAIGNNIYRKVYHALRQRTGCPEEVAEELTTDIMRTVILGVQEALN